MHEEFLGLEDSSVEMEESVVSQIQVHQALQLGK
jgi:hypothetical protein